MRGLRIFRLQHRRLAAMLVALALAMKALVPAGFMVDAGARTLTVHICADSIGQIVAKQIVLPLAGHDGTGHDDTGRGGHGDTPCHFTALGHASLGGADPVLLLLALAFVLALGFLPLAPLGLARIGRLRPPLRGPPLPA